MAPQSSEWLALRQLGEALVAGVYVRLGGLVAGPEASVVGGSAVGGGARGFLGTMLDFALKGATMATLLSRITINPDICHGKPTIRGLRYPVETILELLSSGMTIEEILADYEDLEREDILAVLAFAARLSQVKRLETVAA
jgi:uncharacterized protein (DUF433 family)